jgi:hypothetical protein
MSIGFSSDFQSAGKTGKDIVCLERLAALDRVAVHAQEAGRGPPRGAILRAAVSSGVPGVTAAA